MITYELLANPHKPAKLKEELSASLPSLGIVPALAVAKRLAYLKAVIRKGLHLHPGNKICAIQTSR